MRFLFNEPAILHRGALIVGDVHLGVEEKLAGKGVHQEGLSGMIVDRLISLIGRWKAEKLIVLGDLKQGIGYVDQRTDALIRKLCDASDVTLVKGNHDGGMEGHGYDMEIIGPEGFVYCGVGLAHGHAWPSGEVMACRELVTAHQHPKVRTAEGSEHVWLFAEPNPTEIRRHYPDAGGKCRLIVLPPFNQLVGGTIVERGLGPILNNKLFKWDDANTYRLDGTYIGRLRQYK